MSDTGNAAMPQGEFSFRHSLISKLILVVGAVLIFSMTVWAFFSMRFQKQRLMANIIATADRLTHTIRLGTHYAMMLNARDDISQIIRNVSKLRGIENIRIYNKVGKIKFSDHAAEIGQPADIKSPVCVACHHSDPPAAKLSLSQRIRIFEIAGGRRMLGIVTPIPNAPGCSSGACHVHPGDKKILGVLDVVMSLAGTDQQILKARRGIIALTAFIFLITSTVILLFLHRFVNRPIRQMIDGTRQIAKGEFGDGVHLPRNDEMGHLARAINQMGQEISRHQAELNRQRDEYQTLFEKVPCLITVQDRNFQLLKYNQEFARRFDPKPGDTCFQAYKGRRAKCEDCPVELTFADGQSHHAEETGINKDGSLTHWIVGTSAIRNKHGEIVAAMEISHDITERCNLQAELAKSERKYRAIFNNIPNPVFMLETETFRILDCNKSVTAVYGYPVEELLGTSFLELFNPSERDHYGFKIATRTYLHKVRHRHKSGLSLFVAIRISPAEYAGRKVLLVTTSDITKRLETEQQLIQASKMATLGEMATGVAHELNQPLSVIKTASSFLLTKLSRDEAIDPAVLSAMLTKADRNVDRAAKIINHMRQFARKSDSDMQKIQINAVLQSAFDIFSQQLKVRGIDVKWAIDTSIPAIHADPGRLEQVFINLLLNARDAIEEKWAQLDTRRADDHIRIETTRAGGRVVCRICDTGVGVPEGIRDKIFEPFFTTKEVGKGTGLGLSISYGIVRDCGGSIQVRPNTPGGTCFVLTFGTAQPDDPDTDKGADSA